ncbi:PHP domain-containing protein [Treponema zioleckii]|uniref:PHP domain-containing protein n=1 Tax=Treponema zioleckii TaxID=331680 RepID=UPI00168BBEDD|nr:PHP domain-containing protein [Treponema zioleckii]
MIDLHTHSSASDGMMAPAEAAQYAIDRKLDVWALTDHDTVDGLYDAAKVCSQNEIIFVPGIEITIAWPTGEFHLLGHGLRCLSPELRDVIKYLTEERHERNQQIVNKMNEDGIEVTLSEIESMFGESQIGRPHFASFLLKIGKVKSRQEAFDRYLGSNRPWYIRHNGEDLDTAVEAIKKSGGIPVLAHPMSLYLSWGKIEDVIKSVRDRGVMGLEAWHPAVRVSEAMRLEELARKLDMFVTAGSDFHGRGMRADRHLARTCGDKKIENRFYFEELLPHLGDFDYRQTDWMKSD